MTQAATREEAMVAFLMNPEKYPDMEPADAQPQDHAARKREALVAYLKWMSAVETNGFPIHFGHIQTNK